MVSQHAAGQAATVVGTSIAAGTSMESKGSSTRQNDRLCLDFLAMQFKEQMNLE